jgi:PKD-like domain/Secretion system C-terminal sorting domain
VTKNNLIPKFCLFLSILFFSTTSSAQTTLEAGDISFTGYITADDNNVTQDVVISFVLLKDMDVNTIINFTDFGWTDANTFQTPNPCGVNTGALNDGIIEWKSNTVLYCGTQISINCKRALTANLGTVTAVQASFNNSNVYLNLNGTGDQVFAYQGTVSAPSFIAALSIDRDWDLVLDSCEFTSNKSTLPAALSLMELSINPGAYNAQYNCSITTGDTLALLTAITDALSWNVDTTSFPPIPVNFQLPLSCVFTGCALPAPQITTQPISVNVCELSNIELSVVANNATSYQWQQNISGTWVDVIDTLPFSGSTTDTLRITAAPFVLNASVYRCVVSGQAPPQAMSTSANVSLIRLPAITAQTPARAICEGLNVSFSVSTVGAGLTFQWQTYTGTSWVNLTNTPPYSNTTASGLLITAIPYALHLSYYRCIVTGTCAPAVISDSVYIFVNQLPTITVEPVSDSLCVGNSTSFFVNAFGSAINYRWQVDNGSGYVNVPNSLPYSGFNNDTLAIITPSTALNSFKYRCIVAGVCNPVDTSLEAILTVGDVPTDPVFNSGSTSLCLNSSEVFTVAPVDGISTYTWNFTGTDGTITSAGDTSATLDLGIGASAGNVTVQASNFCGISGLSSQSIIVNASYQFLDSLAICPGDSALINSVWQLIPGDYVDAYTTVDGCDSSYTTRLQFNPIYNEQVTAMICVGDSSFLAGAWQTLVGTYTDTLSSVQGCDSIVHTSLDFYAAAFDSIASSICIGDSLFVGGAWQITAGTYEDTLTSSNGCDSLLYTTLDFFPIAFDSVDVSICDGDSVFLAGAWQYAAGHFVDVTTSSFGCDSTVYTHLLVNALPLVSLTLDTTVCINWLFVDLFGESPAGGTWSGIGVSGSQFEPSSVGPGGYVVTYTYVDSNFCLASASDTIIVDLCTGLQEIDGVVISIYPNPVNANLNVQFASANASTSYQIIDTKGSVLINGPLNQSNLAIPVNQLANGIYFIQIIHQGKMSTSKFSIQH